jgi:hypothetical protein
MQALTRRLEAARQRTSAAEEGQPAVSIDPKAPLEAQIEAARAQWFEGQGFSQADAAEMARAGGQVPRAELERLLGRRLPGTRKWL